MIPPKGKGREAKIGDPCPKCDGSGGAKFGGNFRNYSHLWESGWESPGFGDGGRASGYINASKGEKPAIRAFLERDHGGPWFAAIADSGQKHVLPFTPMNARGRAGYVLFDERTIAIPRSLVLVDALTEMLTSGITKDELDRGEYYVRTMRDSRPLVEAFEAKHGSARGSGWFTLALWLAQRDEAEHERRTEEKKARDTGGRDAAVPAKRVSVRKGRKATNELLDADPRPSTSGSATDYERERVGEQHAAPPTDRRTGQGRLPGFD